MNGIYYGNGWGYKPGKNGNAATLYLCPDVPKEFDLNYKKVRCDIEVSQTATLTKLSISFAGDNFTINNAGTIQNSEFSLCSVTNTGTIKDSTFRKTNVTNENSITGCFWLELYGDPTGTISNSGIITNSLFQVDPHKVGLDESTVVHTFRAIGTDSIWCDMPDNPCFARHSNESYTSSCFYTIGSFKIAVHYDDDYGPKYSYKITAINGIPAEKSGHGISYDGTAWYTLTVDNEDIVLSDAFDTSLEIVNGYPNTNNREPIYATDATDDTTIIGWKGNGWKYENGTLTLKSGKYDFNYTVPRFDGSIHDLSDPHLYYVNVDNIVVEDGATIVGGMFNEQSLSNYGTVTNALFNGDQVENYGTLNCLFSPKIDQSKPTGIVCHSLTSVDNTTVEALLFSSKSPPISCTIRHSTLYFTGTPKLTVKLDNNHIIQCINGRADYGDLKPSGVSGYYTFTPNAGEDVVLNLNYYITDLVITKDGFPDTTGREPIYQDNNPTKQLIGYRGNGWKYENGTLTLESGEYDFNYTKPKDTASERYSYTVECSVVVNKGAAITGGKFSGDTFSNSGTVKDVLIKEGQITNNGTLSCLFGLLPPSGTGFTRHTMTAVDGSKIYYTVNQHLSIGGVYKLYFTGTPKFTVRLENSTIHYINGEEHYGGLTSPDGKGYQTFTPEKEEDIVLNREPYVTDLVITEGGIPDTTGREPIYDSANNVIGCKGEGWKYENDTLTLESGSYDFSKNGLGQLAPDVKLVVGPSVTLTGGVFNEKPDGLTTDNVQTIILNGSDSIVAVNGLSSAKWNTTLYAIKDSQVEIKADTDITNINGWDIGKFPGGSSYPNGEDDKTTVSFRMPDGPVVLNDTLYTLDIIRGKTLGNTSVAVPAGTELPLVADEPKENETFLGWRLSDESLLKDGTLNDPECKTIKD